MNERMRAHIVVAAIITISGCASVDAPQYPEYFDPHRLLHEEFRLTSSNTVNQVILPEDLSSRPELKEVISRYLSTAESQSSDAALKYLDDAIEGGSRLSPSGIADLHLVRASAMYERAKFLEAKRSCDHAIELDPKNWRAFHFRAMLNQRKHYAEGFEDDMRHAKSLREGKPIRWLSTTPGFII